MLKKSAATKFESADLMFRGKTRAPLYSLLYTVLLLYVHQTLLIKKKKNTHVNMGCRHTQVESMVFASIHAKIQKSELRIFFFFTDQYTVQIYTHLCIDITQSAAFIKKKCIFMQQCVGWGGPCVTLIQYWSFMSNNFILFLTW